MLQTTQVFCAENKLEKVTGKNSYRRYFLKVAFAQIITEGEAYFVQAISKKKSVLGISFDNYDKAEKAALNMKLMFKKGKTTVSDVNKMYDHSVEIGKNIFYTLFEHGNEKDWIKVLKMGPFEIIKLYEKICWEKKIYPLIGVSPLKKDDDGKVLGVSRLRLSNLFNKNKEYYGILNYNGLLNQLIEKKLS